MRGFVKNRKIQIFIKVITSLDVKGRGNELSGVNGTVFLKDNFRFLEIYALTRPSTEIG